MQYNILKCTPFWTYLFDSIWNYHD